MATTSQSNEEAQELKRLFHQTKKTFPILSYKDMADESVKPVLNTLAGYEPYHESPPFSINDAKYVTANLISVSDTIQDSKYHVNLNKPVIWLQRFIKAHNVDYVNYLYLEGIHFTQYETTDASLKHCIWFLKSRGVIQQ